MNDSLFSGFADSDTPPGDVPLVSWWGQGYSKSAMAGLAIVLALFLCAIFADWIAPYSYETPVGNSLEPPSWKFPLGTDPIGRDVFSRVIYGTRIALFVGLGSVVLALIVGIPIGVCGAYYGGWFDMIMMRFMDIILAFPVFLLAILVMAILGPSTSNVLIALAVVRVPIFARVVRGTVLSVKEMDYIQAAKSVSVKDGRLLFRHVLPNCMGPIIVLATISIAFAILVEASLSFLGVGTQPPTPSWGFDLKQNLISLEENASIVIAPGIAIMLTVLGFNLFGDGLRDALDPKMRG